MESHPTSTHRCLAKARAMTKGQKRSAVARKRAAGNTGPKPKNVATFTKNVATCRGT